MSNAKNELNKSKQQELLLIFFNMEMIDFNRSY